MADLAITAANVSLQSGNAKVLIAGEAITAGQSLFKKAADGKAYKAQSDSTAAEAACIGVAINNAAAGQPVSYAGTAGDVINIGATVTVGETYIVPATAGGIAPVADISTNFTSFIGYGSTTGRLTLMLTNTGLNHG